MGPANITKVFELRGRDRWHWSRHPAV